MSNNLEERKAIRIGLWTLGLIALATAWLASELYVKYGWLEAVLLVYAQIQVLLVALSVGQLHNKMKALDIEFSGLIGRFTGIAVELQKLPAALSEFVSALGAGNVSRH